MGVRTTAKANAVNTFSWQAVKTANFTAVAGEGYFVNTTSGAVTVTLPASPVRGDSIIIRDYSGTFGTNNLTINPNSAKLDAQTGNGVTSTNNEQITLTYIDATQGWKTLYNAAVTSAPVPLFTSATGGTVTTSGNYKIHTFTGDGCFVVSQLGNSPTAPTGGPANVDYLVVAGGGGGGGGRGGGAGGGGFREGRILPAPQSYTASPLVSSGGLPVSVTTYPIIVGGGGAPGSGTPAAPLATSGSPSIFSTITSSGGAGSNPPIAGGSGAGGVCAPGGAGNTPPVSPSQGNPGGSGGMPGFAAGGGGGAGGAGTAGSGTAGSGGVGVSTSISGSSLNYAGGGAGGASGAYGGTPGSGSPCGTGGGAGVAGTTNRGGGGGSNSSQPCLPGGAGGKGIVIIRYQYQ